MATYYVSKSGNDSTGNGSVSTPWLTMNKAESSASNGDLVIVLAGTYIEDDPSLHAFWSLKAIEWSTQGGEVIVKSVSTTYVVVFGGTTVGKLTGFTFDGEKNTTNIIYFGNGTNNKSLVSCTLRNPVASGNVATCSGTTSALSFDTCTITDDGVNATAVIVGGATSNFKLINSTITLTGTTKLLDISSAGSGYCTITGNTILSSAIIAGTFLYMTGGTRATNISGNTITFSAAIAQSVILLANQVNPIVDGNEISTLFSVATATHININSTGTDCGTVTVSNNTCRTTAKTGRAILIGTDTTGAGNNKLDGAKITGNTIYGSLYYDRTLATNGLHGIEYGWNKGGLITNNYIDGCAYNIVVKGGNEDYKGRGGVHFNVLVDAAGTESAATSAFLRLKGVSNVPVCNNTFSLSAAYTVANGLIHITDGDSAFDDSTGNIIKNNLMVGKNGVPFINCENDGSSLTAADVNHNLYWSDTGTGLDFTANGTDYASFALWMAGGFDVNSPTPAGPLFLDGSYRLHPGSPAIKTGRKTAQRGLDIAGQPVMRGRKMNIGAYADHLGAAETRTARA